MENEVEELEKVTERLGAVLGDISSDYRSMNESLNRIELMLYQLYGPMPLREVKIDEPTTTIEPADQSINGEFEVLLKNSDQNSCKEMPLDEISERDVLEDDDLLTDLVLEISDTVKNDEEIFPIVVNDELNLLKEFSHLAARQVFDEPPNSQNSHECELLVEFSGGIDAANQDEFEPKGPAVMMLRLQDNLKVDESLNELQNNNLKIVEEVCFDPGGKNNVRAENHEELKALTVKKHLTSTHTLLPMETGIASWIAKDHYAGMFNFDPGGIWLRSSVDGITFKVGHEGLNEEQDDLKVPQVNSMEDVLPSLLDKSDFINMFKLLNEFAAQEKMMNAYTGVVCFDPGGKYVVRIGMLGNCVEPLLNPLLVEPLESDSQWGVLLGNNDLSLGWNTKVRLENQEFMLKNECEDSLILFHSVSMLKLELKNFILRDVKEFCTTTAAIFGSRATITLIFVFDPGGECLKLTSNAHWARSSVVMKFQKFCLSTMIEAKGSSNKVPFDFQPLIPENKSTVLFGEKLKAAIVIFEALHVKEATAKVLGPIKCTILILVFDPGGENYELIRRAKWFMLEIYFRSILEDKDFLKGRVM